MSKRPPTSPFASPCKKIERSPCKDRYSDRFIPFRSPAKWQIDFDDVRNRPKKCTSELPPAGPNETVAQKCATTYRCLLKNEMLSAEIDDIQGETREEKLMLGRTPSHTESLFQYKSPKRTVSNNSPYTLSPLGMKSQKLLKTPRKPVRTISRVPYKVLDAPDLQDDFYLNLIDWSHQNLLAVGLGPSVYLWNAGTSEVTRLCDLSEENDLVTSVAWADRGNNLALGTDRGHVQIWDVAMSKKICTLAGRTSRVGSLAWNGDLLSSGSRDRMIYEKDIRAPGPQPERILLGHKQEVCGLKWSPDKQLLASGGNDNKLHIWSQTSQTPVQTFGDHMAAVKAISWSPHQNGLLASGGGTADQHIRFSNALNGQSLHSVDTGSQVCNLVWSKHSNELVSTHGYSQNQICVWKYPALTQIAKLTGHTYRVLYLAMSPDGQSIVTGAGDETLRFWNVFINDKSKKSLESRSVLNMFNRIR